MRDLVVFGKTALEVSRLCQGTAFRHLPRADDPRGLEVLRHCLAVGVNFFDSAQAYGWGGAERVLGKALAGRRHEAVICTKVPAMLPPKAAVAAVAARFTREYLGTQLEGSLQRLGTDYVDLYLLHQPDAGTPPEEVMASMEALVAAGKVRYWGLSNHSVAQVQAYLDLGAAIAGVEDYYNVAGSHLDGVGRVRVKVFEQELLPLVQRRGLGCLAFSPLDTGMLAPGKAVDGALAALVAVIDGVAAALEVPRAAVCVAWVLHQGIPCVLAGAESVQHVDDNLLGTKLELPTEMLVAIGAARDAYHRHLLGSP